MRYIKRYSDGQWGDYTAYWAYLKSVEEVLPPNIAAFALDESNYNLTDPNSLHDAWLDSRIIREDQIDLRFLGSRHDRNINLRYCDVTRCEMGLPGDKDDLLVHEMRVVRDAFEHELIFASGASILIEFKQFDRRIDLL